MELCYNYFMKRCRSIIKQFFFIFILFETTFSFAQESASDEDQPVEEINQIEGEAEKKDNFILKTMNFIRNLPFGFDLGCEPTLNGSLLYFNVKYNWTKDGWLSSKLLFNYGTTLDVDLNGTNSLSVKGPSSTLETIKREKKDTAIDFKLIPTAFTYYSHKTPEKYFSIEPGFNYRFENEKEELIIMANGKNVYFLKYLLEDHKNVIRPYFSGTLFTPVGSMFSASLDLLYAPAYLYWAKGDSSVYISYSENNTFRESYYPINYTTFGYAVNYIDTTLRFNMFNFIAVSGRLIYERDHKEDVYADSSDPSTAGGKKTKALYEKISFKFGGSFINIGKADIRIKTGVFYQWDWKYNNNTNSWTKEGKWIFGVGMRNLY